MELKFEVTGQKISYVGDAPVSGSYGRLSMKFEFSADWDSLYKVAVIDHERYAHPVFVLIGADGTVDADALSGIRFISGEWTVGVIGTESAPVALPGIPAQGTASCEEYLLGVFGSSTIAQETTSVAVMRVLGGVWTAIDRGADPETYQAMVNAVISAKDAMEECTAAVAAEETARAAADTALGGRIDGEATARSNADTALTQRIAAEETARAAAISAHKTEAVLDHPNGSVKTEKLAKSAVTTEKLADGAVTKEKLYKDLKDEIEAKDVLEGEMTENGFVISGDLSPCVPEGGKIYIDTVDKMMYRWDETSYEEISHAVEISELYTAVATKAENRYVLLELAKKVSNSKIGQANGVAGLDASGRIPSAQLPSYVDDVLEGEMTENGFVISGDLSPCVPEGGKIYVDSGGLNPTNKCYRWGGSVYVEISASLALGETASTAFAGDRGAALEGRMATAESSITSLQTAVAAKADSLALSSEASTRAAADTALDTRVTALEQGGGGGTVDAYTKAQTDALLAGKADAEDMEAISDVTIQTSRNRYDPSDTDAETGKKFTSTKTGATTDASGYVITGYIDVHENHGKYLTYSTKVITTGTISTSKTIYAVCVYDQNKEIIQKTTVFNFSSYIIPDDAYYVRVNLELENSGNNRITQVSITDDNVETVVEEYAPPETLVTIKTSAIPGYAGLTSDVQGLTVGGSKTYGFALGGLANDGITPSASTNRAHSEWVYSKGLTEITAPTGYTVKAAYCFDQAFSLIGTGTTTNGNAQLLDGTVWVRIAVADAEDASKDLTDDVADITVTVSGADIALGRDAADKEYLPKTLPLNPEWENWKNERYSWGFNKNSDQPFIEADAPFEASMISVKGGKGRWHTQGTPTHTPSPSAFVDGGHLFEGWNADETLRLTMLIGKYDYKMACIQCYGTPELNQGQRVYGYIKVGSDNANFGVNFGEKSAKFFVPILLQTKATAPTEVTAMYETGDTTTVPVGAMYYDTTADRVKVMTASGWKSMALEV